MGLTRDVNIRDNAKESELTAKVARDVEDSKDRLEDSIIDIYMVNTNYIRDIRLCLLKYPQKNNYIKVFMLFKLNGSLYSREFLVKLLKDKDKFKTSIKKEALKQVDEFLCKYIKIDFFPENVERIYRMVGYV